MVSKEVKEELTSMMERVNTTEREISHEAEPSHTFKYASKWRSARYKLKSRFMLKSLMKDLNLYGTNQDYMDELELYLTEAKLRKNTSIYSLVEVDEAPKNPWVIYPTSNFKSIWNICLIMLLFYTATLMPYRLSFSDKTSRDGWWYWDLLLDFGFCIDIVVNCFSAYVNSDGETVTNNRLILWNYTKSWLLIDVIAVFPFDFINEDQDSGDSKGGYNSLIRLVRLPRLYRLVRISRVIKAFSEVNQSEWVEKLQEMIRIKHSIMRLLTSFLTVLVCLHIMACFWYFAAKLNDLDPDTWVFRFGYMDATEGRLYLASLYWALTTLATVGYGDITPGTNIEKCLAMAWMVFGMIFFSFTIGSLTSMLSGIDTKETVLSNKLSVVDEFAKESHLSKAIQKRLRIALRYSTDKQGFSWADKIGIFNELPRKLRYEVALVMHKGAVKNFPFFADKDPVFISSTVPFLQSIMIPEGEFIFKEGEYADEIYFLVRGRAALVTADGKVPYKSLQANSYFGEIELIKQVPRRYSSMALVDCDLLTLSRQMVNLIKEEFPAIWTEMVEVAENRDKLNSQTKRALRHLQKLKRTGEIEGMSHEQVKESVDAYAKASEPFEVPEPNEEEELDDLTNFITDIEIQLAEAADSIQVLLQKLNSQSTPMSRRSR
jgi:CRP-like cAMP-binding protein